MPPRAVKKASGGAATAAKRAAKVAPKPAEVAGEAAKAEETAVEVKEVIKAEQVVVEKKEEKPLGVETEANGSVGAGVEKYVKEAFEEEDKGERLELEDNELEYDPEEDTAIDYGQEEDGSEGEEDGEEGGMREEEEEGDEMIDEDMEGGGEDAEGEEDVEGEEEEHEVDLEEEEDREVAKDHRKRKEFEVFVGGLDKDVTEADLKKVFSKVGDVTEVRLMMNPLTKKNKGFAFLRFATVEQAKRAVSELKNPVVNGKQCGVAPSQDNDTLFLGNICKTWTKEYLKEKLKNYGIENIEDLTLVEDTNNKGMNRGFAFLEFSSRSEAMNTYRLLQKRDVILGTDRTAKVAFADSFIEPDDEIMAQIKTVFVDGLPASWDEDRVKEYLKKYGVIEKIELARNMPSAKRKDFGFVTFVTHDNAVACAEGINNVDLDEGGNKVKVRARLSRPRQRGRGGRGARGNFRIGRGALGGGRVSYSRPPPRRLPVHVPRAIRDRGIPIQARGFKRPIGFRERRPVAVVEERPRRLPPLERPYDRRPPIPAYPKSSSKRDYIRRDAPPLRSRATANYVSRIPIERRPSYRDDYPSRGSGYSDIAPRIDPRAANRRSYADDGYGQKLERTLPVYPEGHSQEYDSISRSKRPYSELDDSISRSKRPYSELDDAPRYPDVSTRQSRARLDYGVTSSGTLYNDAYADRLERSHMGYSSRSSLSDQDGLYRSHQGMNYIEGSVSGSGGSGMYSSSFSSSARGSNVGGSSYSSIYSGRSLSSSRYLGSSGSGSYY